jgi:hypothetical protein
LKIAKDLIESGTLKYFRDIFRDVPKTEISKRLGINYTRFREPIKNSKRLRYAETYSIPNIFQVPARTISELIHNQVETRKSDKSKK